MNCIKSLTGDHVKPLIVQKNGLIRSLNYQENKGNASLHPSLSHSILLIIFINSMAINIMIKVYNVVFQFFPARTETLV